MTTPDTVTDAIDFLLPPVAHSVATDIAFAIGVVALLGSEIRRRSGCSC